MMKNKRVANAAVVADIDPVADNRIGDLAVRADS